MINSKQSLEDSANIAIQQWLTPEFAQLILSLSPN